MLFAIVRSDSTIAKTIRVGKPFSLDGKEYNEKWYERMSAEDKAALGIQEVVYGSRNDERYYWITEQPIAMVNGNPTITYQAISKNLDELKKQQIAQAKQTANSLLCQTDWMVIRKAERGVEIPADVVQFRLNIINNCANAESAIQAATNVEELIAAVSAQIVQTTQDEITITTGGSAIGV